ncbi:radical SAM protein [Streptomyces sp. NBC_01236]|uniref:radical SAM protein n=1 Tax=Streptomyces sp. NBC_01236 TaxID=2903789 RepID=UPI002E1290B4|nr:radical SAM protein [Streptomyces sp. NBC_01236]
MCFADSGHQKDGYSITHEQCARMLDTFVASEGEAEVVMFSGGEPTLHKHILDFIDLAQDRPIKNVTLNTNGIRARRGAPHPRPGPRGDARRPAA